MDDKVFEIENFRRRNPDFNYYENRGKFFLSGVVKLNHEFNNVRFLNEYSVEIVIDDNFWLLGPSIYEKNGQLKNAYAHINMNGSLCVAAFSEVFEFISENREENKGEIIELWVNNFVVPYFFSYEYFQEYRVYPFGDRSHGSLGVLEYYKEIFGVNNIKQVIDLGIYIISSKQYRGHVQCPCNSGSRVRSCHKDIIMNYLKDNEKKTILSLALELVLQEINNEK